MTLFPAFGLYGLLAAFVYLLFHYEAELPLGVCLALTVSAIVLGAGVASATTFLLPLNFLQATAAFGVMMFLMGSMYSIADTV